MNHTECTSNTDHLKICIKSVGRSFEEEEPMVTTQVVEASFFQKGEAYYLFYEESIDENNKWKTRVKYKRGILEVDRQGVLGCKMIFEVGNRYRTAYPTPYGRLDLDIITESLLAEEKAAGWPKLTVRYRLENDESPLSSYELSIKEV